MAVASHVSLTLLIASKCVLLSSFNTIHAPGVPITQIHLPELVVKKNRLEENFSIFTIPPFQILIGKFKLLTMLKVGRDLWSVDQEIKNSVAEVSADSRFGDELGWHNDTESRAVVCE